MAGRHGEIGSRPRLGGDRVQRHPAAFPMAPMRPAASAACVRPAAGTPASLDCIRNLMMNTRLRDLAMHPIVAPLRTREINGLFWLGVLAIVLQFLLSRHVLEAIGVAKPPNVHVATLLLCIGAVYSLTHGVVPLSHWLRKAPGLMLFLAGI